MKTTQLQLKNLNPIQREIYQKLFEVIKQQKFEEMAHLKDEEKTYYYREGIMLNIFIQKKYDVKKSLESWIGLTKWLLSNNAHNITHKSVENELKAGTAYFYQRDNKGQPALTIKVKTRNPGQINIKETEYFFIYLLNEWYELSETSPTGKCVLLWDREGFTKKNHDQQVAELMKNISHHLQTCMMARLDKIYILHPNWFFRMLFTLFRVFISQELKARLEMISEIQNLSKYFDSQNLILVHGGTSSYTFDYETEFGNNNHNSDNEFYRNGNYMSRNYNQVVQQRKVIQQNSTPKKLKTQENKYQQQFQIESSEYLQSPLKLSVQKVISSEIKENKLKPIKFNSEKYIKGKNDRDNDNDWFQTSEFEFDMEDIAQEYSCNNKKTDQRYKSLSVHEFEELQKEQFIQQLGTYDSYKNSNNQLFLSQLLPLAGNQNS